MDPQGKAGGRPPPAGPPRRCPATMPAVSWPPSAWEELGLEEPNTYSLLALLFYQVSSKAITEDHVIDRTWGEVKIDEHP